MLLRRPPERGGVADRQHGEMIDPWPTTWARSTPASLKTAMTSPTSEGKEYEAAVPGLSERP